MEPEPTSVDPTDDAVSKRLGKLGQLRMELSGLDARLKAKLPAEATGSAPRATHWSMPLAYRALAACLLVGLLVLGAVLLLSARPVLASEQQLADIFQDTTSSRSHATPVATIEEARTVLRGKWPGAPLLTEPDDARLMHCCVHELGRRQMACITFELDGQPVTLASASSSDIRSPAGQTQTINGQRYVTGSAQGVNMVMFEQDEVWMCVMGRLPLPRLVEIASTLRR